MSKLFEMINIRVIVVIVIALFVLTRCHAHHSISAEKTEVLTIAPQTLSNTLFYAGTLRPLKVISVVSPAEGVIEEMTFHYGDKVKAGQVLFTINSEKFQSDYKAALIQYVKARSEMNNNHSQLMQGEFLHKNKLISDDEFKVRETNFYNAQLAFLQAKDSLAVLLRQLDIKNINLYDLTISDIEKINSALHMKGDSQKLQIISPSEGLALLPAKTDSGTQKMDKGTTIKQGDVLALIGDGKGLSIEISINEFDISQIKSGQQVKITGAAFPDYVLEGQIAGVDHQAQNNQSGIPIFTAEVVIPELTEAQKKSIYVGMSAKVEVLVSEPEQITVPIAAVTEKNGIAMVKRQDASGLWRDVPVKTGKTTADAVVILDALKAGDKIAVAH